MQREMLKLLSEMEPVKPAMMFSMFPSSLPEMKLFFSLSSSSLSNGLFRVDVGEVKMRFRKDLLFEEIKEEEEEEEAIANAFVNGETLVEFDGGGMVLWAKESNVRFPSFSFCLFENKFKNFARLKCSGKATWMNFESFFVCVEEEKKKMETIATRKNDSATATPITFRYVPNLEFTLLDGVEIHSKDFLFTLKGIAERKKKKINL